MAHFRGGGLKSRYGPCEGPQQVDVRCCSNRCRWAWGGVGRGGAPWRGGSVDTGDPRGPAPAAPCPARRATWPGHATFHSYSHDAHL